MHWRLKAVGGLLMSRSPIASSDARPWFQVDRGGDFHQLLRWAIREDAWPTVRAQHDRCVRDPFGRKLWEALGARHPCATFAFNVLAVHARAARVATLTEYTGRVEIELKDWSGSRVWRFRLHAVLVREEARVPAGATRLAWLLLTTYPITTVTDVRAVAEGYATRWSIESFHKTWKSDLCHVEDTPICGARRRW